MANLINIEKTATYAGNQTKNDNLKRCFNDKVAKTIERTRIKKSNVN